MKKQRNWDWFDRIYELCEETDGLSDEEKVFLDDLIEKRPTDSSWELTKEQQKKAQEIYNLRASETTKTTDELREHGFNKAGREVGQKRRLEDVVNWHKETSNEQILDMHISLLKMANTEATKRIGIFALIGYHLAVIEEERCGGIME